MRRPIRSSGRCTRVAEAEPISTAVERLRGSADDPLAIFTETVRGLLLGTPIGWNGVGAIAAYLWA